MLNHVIHEIGHGEDAEDKPGSNRAFGLVFAFVFAVMGCSHLLFHGEWTFRALPLCAAGIFLVLALTAPRVLHPLNNAWFRMGILMGKVMNPVIMGLLFFVVVTPMAMILKLLGKDPMKRTLDPQAPSYWTERRPAGPEADSMPYQF